MPNASGRYSGSYGQGRSRSQNFPPRAHAAAPVDTSQLASALKVRNFKTLLEAAGSAENLGIALELPTARVEELSRGERFSAETAYHIETTLELPSGYLDRVNPKLTDDVLNRLKSPDEYKKADSDPAPSPQVVPPMQQDTVQPSNPSTEPRTQEVDMPRASGNAHAANAAAPAAPRKRGRPPVQRSDTPTPEEELLELRRLNLHVLTAQPGSKGKLGEILGMSPANISHRLHGLKKLDDEQVMLITTALEMDPKWFDSPRKEKDVPASVHKLLDPGPKLPRGAKKAAREAAKAARTAGTAPAKRAARKTPTRVLAPADLSMPRLSAGVVSAAPAAAQTPAPSPAIALVGGGPAAAPAASAARRAPAPAAAPAAAPVARSPAPAPAATAVGPTTPALNDEDLSGISHLGVALIKMLAVKARQGRLDDARAIALLTEVAQL